MPPSRKTNLISFKDKLLSSVIVLLVWSIVLFMTYNIVTGWLRPVSTNTIAETPNNCVPLKISTSDKKVVIRIDDIQAMAYREVSQELIENSLSVGVPVVLGVIPKNISTDEEITRLINNNICNLEVALHGWDHSYSTGEKKQLAEFEAINQPSAEERIAWGMKEVNLAFNLRPVTFIPPDNILSDAAVAALIHNKIRNISRANNGYMDLTTATYDFEHNTQIPLTEIINACESKFSIKQICVIVVHPQDFLSGGATDKSKLKNYLDLLTYITGHNWQPVLFKDLSI